MAAEKRDFEINNKASNTNNNTENPQQIVDSSSTLSSDANKKEAEERQARDLKAGLHPLKVSLPPYFLFECVISLLGF